MNDHPTIPLDTAFLTALRYASKNLKPPPRHRYPTLTNVALLIRHIEYRVRYSTGVTRGRGGYKYTYQSYDDLARDLGMGRRTLARALAAALPFEVLVVRRVSGKRNEYRIDYQRLVELMEDAGIPVTSDWMHPPADIQRELERDEPIVTLPHVPSSNGRRQPHANGANGHHEDPEELAQLQALWDGFHRNHRREAQG